MKKTDLPEGWIECSMGDLCQPISKTDPRRWSNPQEFIYFDIGGIDNKLHRIAEPSRVASSTAASRARQVVRPGDVLFSTVRTYLENIAFVPSVTDDLALIASTGFCVLRAAEGVDSRFLYYRCLAADLLSAMTALQQGTNYPAIRDPDLLGFKIEVPGSNEQRRIADELERRLSHVDAAVAGLRSALHRVQFARQSIRSAAVTGAQSNAPGSESLSKLLDASGVSYEHVTDRPGWIMTQLGKVARVGSGSTPKRGDRRYWENGTIPWVTSGQVNQGMIHAPAAFITQEALNETSVRIWPAGTLLLAMYGEGKTRGKCAELAINSTCNQACAAIYLENELSVLQPFIKLALQAHYEENRRLGGGGVQENLNLGLVKEMLLVLPDLDLQARLVAEAERRLSLIDAAERAIAANLTKAEQLRRSLLATALDGQLVPQDPDDEPAQQLLERIRERRAAQATAETATKATPCRSTRTKKKEPSA